MRVHPTLSGTRRTPAILLGVASIVVAACVAAPQTRPPSTPSTLPTTGVPTVTPSLTASPTATPPIYCDDGPTAHTPMPADCLIPSQALPSGFALPSFGLFATKTPWPNPSSNLPKLAPWRGSQILGLGSGIQAYMIGTWPDGSLAVLQYWITETGFSGSVLSIRPDGTPKPGWPVGGVPAPVGYGSQAMGGDGTVYVAAVDPGATQDTPTSIEVTAIGPDGKVLSGWPYASPPALHDYASGKLVIGPSGQACFMDYLPGQPAQELNSPSAIYCVGADGKLLPGWPYTSYRPMDHPVFGPDGTLYVEQYMADKPGSQEIVALGSNGKPKPGWTPWTVPSLMVSPIAVAANGRVILMVMVLSGDELVILGPDGSLQSKAALPLPKPQDFHDMATTVDGGLYLSTMDDGELAMFGKTTGHISAFTRDGAAKHGWPVTVDGPNAIFLSPDGSVWTTWEIWNADERTGTAMAVFDSNGKLREGFPTETPDLGDLLVFDSSGTAYAIMNSTSGASVVKIPG